MPFADVERPSRGASSESERAARLWLHRGRLFCSHDVSRTQRPPFAERSLRRLPEDSPLNNIEKLTTVGLIAPETRLSPDEIAALGTLSEMEIAMLVSDHTQVRARAEEPRIPTYHVVF